MNIDKTLSKIFTLTGATPPQWINFRKGDLTPLYLVFSADRLHRKYQRIRNIQITWLKCVNSGIKRCSSSNSKVCYCVILNRNQIAHINFLTRAVKWRKSTSPVFPNSISVFANTNSMQKLIICSIAKCFFSSNFTKFVIDLTSLIHFITCLKINKKLQCVHSNIN